MTEARRPPIVLTIAGTDPSGGAGIQADLKTFTSLQCYGTSVTTALVAQNTTGVQEVYAPPSAFIATQLRSVLDDFPVDALKTGMLFNAEITAIVVSTLKSYHPNEVPVLVVDPVCVSTSGHTLLEPKALSILLQELLPMATVVTPNKLEAELLLSGDLKITSVEAMLVAAKSLSTFGSKAVLLKGGHTITSASEIAGLSKSGVIIEWAEGCRDALGGDLILKAAHRSNASKGAIDARPPLVVDVLYQTASPDEYILFVRPQIRTKNTHGTGCTLSAALACELAGGKSVLEATRAATKYTHLGIATTFPLGRGNGPLNHMHSILTRSVPLPSLSNPFPFISAMIHSSSDTWLHYVKHPFVRSLGAGTLGKKCFIHFIKQDYHYLKYYARAHGLISAKSTSFKSMGASALTVLAVARETNSHAALCKLYDVSLDELVATQESPATTAYGAYLIDVGLRGDRNLLVVAVAACLLGYGEVGLWLQAEAKREGSGFILSGNPYKQWIEEYAGENYQEAVREGIKSLEAQIAAEPPSPTQFEEMRTVWERCTKLEIGFWDMALRLQ